MRALHVIEPGKFAQEDVDIPVIASGHALIRLEYALVCGSDIPKYMGEWPEFPIPLKVGKPLHECVGVVEDSAVAGLQPDTRVLAIPNEEAGLSEFFVSSEDMIVQLDDWPPDDLPTAVLGQPTATVIFAVDKLDNVRGARVLIVGLGGMGHICAMVLREACAGTIVGIEPNEFRRKHAADLLDVDARSEWSDDLRDGFDITIEVVGRNQFVETSQMCLDAVRPHGTILLLGLPTVADPNIGVRPIMMKNLRIVGSLAPAWREFLPRGVEMVRHNPAAFRSLITHRFSWTEAENAFNLFMDRDAERIKILLHNC